MQELAASADARDLPPLTRLVLAFALTKAGDRDGAVVTSPEGPAGVPR